MKELYKRIQTEKNPQVRSTLINVYSERLKWEAINTRIKRASKTSHLKALLTSHKLTGYDFLDNLKYVNSLIKG